MIEWKPGWYVMLGGKELRGPFEHRETAVVLREHLVDVFTPILDQKLLTVEEKKNDRQAGV